MKNQKIKFDFVFLGQSVLKYQVPLDIFYAINQIYEQNFHRLPPADPPYNTSRSPADKKSVCGP